MIEIKKLKGGVLDPDNEKEVELDESALRELETVGRKARGIARQNRRNGKEVG